MKKLTAADPETRSSDLKAENLAALRALFPELVTEGQEGVMVNLDVLKQLVGDRTVTDAEEKYGMNWHGKRRARQMALTPSTGTLRPCPAESVDWDTTQNIMIEGDNLEVLKLLQKSYSGKVKLIYIDPPYNTGKDFVYPDNFQDNIKNYLELTGQTGDGGKKLSSNTEASGRFHTDWLNMMYPRLKLARNLLRDDGVIFISIDDNEVKNLRAMCDEIFGEENFYANIVWQKKYAVANDDPGIGVMHDHILVYSKADSFNRGLLPRGDEQNARYTNPDNDPKGDWASDNYVSNKSKEERPTLWYPIVHPRTGKEVWPEEHAVWRYSKDKHVEIEQAGGLYWGPDFSYKRPRLKRYLREVQNGIVPPTWWTFDDCGHNDEAQKETSGLLGQKIFSTPKPVRLIDRMLTIAGDRDGLFLDFFAGSGATAHAVIARNASDGGTRRYMLVQLPELLDPNSKDQKVAADFCDKLGKPRTIAELTKERLRRAGKQVREENPMFAGDSGFRVFKLDSSNIRAWDPKINNVVDAVQTSIEHLVDGRSDQDILFEVLLKLGLDLCIPIQTRRIAGSNKKRVHEVQAIGGGTLFACLSPNIPQEDVEHLALGIVEWRKALPLGSEVTTIFRDSAFANDVAKTNLTSILEQHGIETVRSL